MIDFVGTSHLFRIAGWVAMETMHFHIAQTLLRYRMAGITESAMVAYTHKYAVV